jgi:hypothetical protein
MTETKEIPLTIYGLLARKHNTDKEYVFQLVNGIRQGLRGKGAAILADWNKLKDSFDDWITEYKADGSIIVTMEDIHISVYIQRGIARIYKRAHLKQELDIKSMNLLEFHDFLNGIRIEYN